jgi:hypothetical protein
MIYGYIPCGDGYIIRDTPLPVCRSVASNVPHRLAILRVCAQIYLEAAPLPFALNTFTFGSFVTLNNVRYILRYVQRFAVRSIRLKIDFLKMHTDLNFLKDTNRPDDWQLLRVLPRVQFMRIHMPALVGFFYPPRTALRTAARRRMGETLFKVWHLGSSGDFKTLDAPPVLRHCPLVLCYLKVPHYMWSCHH